MILIETVHSVIDFVKQNPVLGGLLGAGGVGTVFVYLKSLPKRLYDLFLEQFTVYVTVKEDGPAFDWIDHYMATLDSMKRSRRFILKRARFVRNDDGEEASPITSRRAKKQTDYSYVLTPGKGRHFFFHKGHFFLIDREKPSGGGGGGSGLGSSDSSEMSKRFMPEILTITTLGRKPDRIRSFIDDAVAFVKETEKEEETINVNIWRYDYWKTGNKIDPRTIESIVTENDSARMILEDARSFLAKRKWYKQRGVPYRRSYLLYGLPGTGKTTLATVLASELNKSIYILNLSSLENDAALTSAVQSVEDNSILLIEDIDTMAVAASREEKEGTTPTKISLSTLLNAIDGVEASEGRILIMTTNHPDKIDDALKRPGRADLKVELLYLGKDKQLVLFKRFYEIEDELMAKRFLDAAVEDISPAELQNIFVMHPHEPMDAIQALYSFNGRQSSKNAEAA